MLFSVDDRACIVEDIVLDWELNGLARKELDSLAQGLKFDGSILEKCNFQKIYPDTI